MLDRLDISALQVVQHQTNFGNRAILTDDQATYIIGQIYKQAPLLSNLHEVYVTQEHIGMKT